jgi:hypothetical protein
MIAKGYKSGYERKNMATIRRTKVKWSSMGIPHAEPILNEYFIAYC